MLDDLTIDLVFVYFLVFCRIGSAVLLLPGLSDTNVSSKARLIVALGLSVLIAPMAKDLLPPLPASAIGFFLAAASEIIIGLLIGSVAKIIFSTMHVAGQAISFQIGLSAANIFDPSQGGQGSTLGMLLNMIAILVIFTTDMHHIFLTGIVDSYRLFSPTDPIPIAGFSEVITKAVSESFLMGIKITAPQIVVGLILFLGAGVMGRLMPQMQVFFVMMPIQIFIGFFILMVTISASMMLFINNYSEIMGSFIAR
ncbi:MAG: flagellar biosynthetic protein FliR [Alphaproteobacteria bacterium CG11_big_fil_rev_8_21_14_0_20_39_49]|nr:MAG: flagellar biosynthetic protein FliR [Alphaproteobacteria bacterium CG11_big_fil_rev_8_21_14_0_20_39_49]